MQETKLCRKCETEKPLNKFRIRKSGEAIYIDNQCASCRGKAERSRLWLEMLEALGGSCACCGESHPQLLTLEHIKGERGVYGRLYGREGKQYRQSNTYVEIRRAKREGWDRTKWELLCASCNFAKGHYGQCPHRTGVTREQVIESLKAMMAGIGIGYRNPLGGESTRYKAGVSRPEMKGNTFYSKSSRDCRGRFTSSEVDAELKRIEEASEER